MGFLDKIKQSFGVGAGAHETIKGPSMVLREKGIDPTGLTFDIGSEGTLTVTGEVGSEAERGPIIAALEEIPQVSGVVDRLRVTVPAEPAPAPAPEREAAPAPEAVPEAARKAEAPAAPDDPTPPEAAAATGSGESAGRTYTVEAGDSLWKIAERFYGAGAKYPVIFEANRDQLDDPDRIRPGQVLKIPDAEG